MLRIDVSTFCRIIKDYQKGPCPVNEKSQKRVHSVPFAAAPMVHFVSIVETDAEVVEKSVIIFI